LLTVRQLVGSDFGVAALAEPEAFAVHLEDVDVVGQPIEDGRIEIDSNSIERTIRPMALDRKNALFTGHDEGGQNWGVIASLIETAKLNGVDPQAYLARILTATVQGHKQSRIDELLPWNYPA
jgi:hypothetical protein